MTTIDFARSFLTFRIDTTRKPPKTVSHQPPYTLNNARIQIECRLKVTEKASQQVQTFVMGANCKTERVGVDRDIWTEPNADFIPIFSDDSFMHLKTYAQAGEGVELFPPGSGTQSERQTGLIADAFDDVRIDIVEAEGTDLTTQPDVVQATLNNTRLNAVTTIENDRYKAVIEYPVKTMNANERDNIFQTDTGPVLFPDLTCEPDQMLTELELAFTAFNAPDWIEVLVRVPTRVNDDVDVYHFSKAIRLDVKNAVIAVS
jgi:hypothetical protein